MRNREERVRKKLLVARRVEALEGFRENKLGAREVWNRGGPGLCADFGHSVED
ncbi:hypothetical protein LR48_Vigan541s001400 [Vigna angularis]|uniref:Uncharacterized protein n=1 Tax=Phaseolus angularis TaxID=3914 RepID=A0A0L9TDB0_PHAAN|nr:hypothetical protein LR48_Vigan541s001400 [Vigna angularis]